ncbi:hypothetical protein GCM10009017_18280 [Halarchaeum rubridurum]|uniref:Uncharacterized protein n=2 Tax=Halarchaeum rubridurum TaxID=489911 RepID=A0A830FZX3_9EURY|nr:hypothetical protein GCM10009017_18280 [Halarchaeum rubridurum]
MRMGNTLGVAARQSGMSTNRPTVGLDHLTVVPTNFDGGDADATDGDVARGDADAAEDATATDDE